MKHLSQHYRYLRYVVLHKYYVYQAGRITGAPLWRLIIHDWSKFSPAEWFPYVERFYGSGAGNKDTLNKDNDAQAFRYAFLHHIHRNPHHWEHWVLKKPQKMPHHFVLEMVADWYGAGRVQTGRWEALEWYAKNKDRLDLHPETRNAAEYWISRVSDQLN